MPKHDADARKKYRINTIRIFKVYALVKYNGTAQQFDIDLSITLTIAAAAGRNGLKPDG